jgi:hypothetical protein
VSWQLDEDTGFSPNDKLTNDVTPTLTFVFSKPVFGSKNDIVIADHEGVSVFPDTLLGWGTDTLVAEVTTALSRDSLYSVTLKGSGTIQDEHGTALNGGSDTVILFHLDTAGPVLVNSTWYTPDLTPELTGGVEDPDAVVNVTVAGKTYVAVNNRDGTWILPDNTVNPPLEVGTYDVPVTATDLAGNMATQEGREALVVYQP